MIPGPGGPGPWRRLVRLLFSSLGLWPCVVPRRGLWCRVSLLCPRPLCPLRLRPCVVPALCALGLGGFFPCCAPPRIPPCVIRALGSPSLAALLSCFLVVPPLPPPLRLCVVRAPVAAGLGGFFPCCASLPPLGPSLVQFRPQVSSAKAPWWLVSLLCLPPPLGVAVRPLGGLPSCLGARCCTASCCAVCVVPCGFGLLCVVLLFLLWFYAVLLAPCGVVVCAVCAGGAPIPLPLLCGVLLLVVFCLGSFCRVCGVVLCLAGVSVSCPCAAPCCAFSCFLLLSCAVVRCAVFFGFVLRCVAVRRAVWKGSECFPQCSKVISCQYSMVADQRQDRTVLI